MGPIQTRVFRQVGLAGNLSSIIDQVTTKVNTFVSGIAVNDMINIEYKIGQLTTGERDVFYIATVTYLIP